MWQVICECGRIAEVRRRSNGKKLRYKVCRCGTALGGVESALKLEREERENIGVYGEFVAQEKAPPSATVESKSEWVPDQECLPDAEDIGEKKGGAKSKNKSAYFVKVGAASVCVLGALFGLKMGFDKLNNN